MSDVRKSLGAQPIGIEEREARILGRPPLIPPLNPDECSEEGKAVIQRVRASIGSDPTAPIPDFTATMMRHPELYFPHMQLALHLYRGALPVRLRELAILRTGWLCQAPYEWNEHVIISKRVANFTTEEVERVTIGSSAPGWTDEETAILRAVEEIHADAMFSEQTFHALARTLDEKQIMELPILIGQYQGVAYIQNSLRCTLRAGMTGLSAR